MIFIINVQGTITAVSPSPIYQGSIEVNDIILVAPVLADTVALNATLPNGIKIDPIDMGIVYPSLSVIEGYTEGYYIYRTTLNEAVTQYVGLLSLRFSLKLHKGGTLATSTAVIGISGDLGLIMPPEISSLDDTANTSNIIDAVNKIINRLHSINSNVASAVESAGSSQSYAVIAESYADQARAWATGETEPNTPVEEVADQYENNAKYYSERSMYWADKSEASADKSEAASINTQNLLDSISISYDYETYKLSITYTSPDGSVEKKEYDFALEPSIVNIEEVKEEGKYYLKLTLANGKTDEIELDDIFNGFVKSDKSQHGKIYGVSPSEDKDVTFNTDMSNPPVSDVTYSGNIVVRTKEGDIIVPDKPLSRVPDYGAINAEQLRDYVGGEVNSAFTNLENRIKEYAASKDSVEKVENRVKKVEERVDILESASLKYTEFSGVTDAVQVPANSARYAIIEEIGGMTYKVVGDNLWDTKSTVTSGDGITVNVDGSITLNGTFDQVYIAIPGLDGDGDVCLSLGTNVLDNNIAILLSKYVEEDDWWDETTISIENGVASWDSSYDAALEILGTIDDVTIYPMLVYGDKPESYKPFSKILRSTDVTSIVSEEANGTLVDSITIPDAVKAKLPEHFELGDGFEFGDDKVYYGNYLDTLTETVHGNVATMVLDGSEGSWTVKTVSSGITRLQIGYSAGLGYPAASAPSTKDATPALCNAYESVSASFNIRGIEGIAFSASTFFVHDPEFTLEHFDSEADILNAWKAHLQNTPLTVVYKVATPVTKDVSNIISDTFNRIAVRSLGKVKPVSEYNTAAMMTITFVEAKGAE